MICVGDKFGCLTVVEDLGSRTYRKQSRRYVLVECDHCKSRYEKRAGILRHFQYKTCQHCSGSIHSTYQIGDKFNNFTIISWTEDKKRKAICQCICGEIRTRQIKSLTKTLFNACSCRPTRKWQGHEEISKNCFSEIQRKADTRNFEFSITIEDMWNLFLKQDRKCALTGWPLCFGQAKTKYHELVAKTASLDRIDSLKGYTLDNIQWVHKDINLMKMDFTQEEFINACKAIAEHCNDDRESLSDLEEEC